MTISVQEINGPAGASKTFSEVTYGRGFKIGGVFYIKFDVERGNALQLNNGGPVEATIDPNQGVTEAAVVNITMDF